MLARLEEERANAEVARKIYDLRIKAKFTQTRLANLVGTTASVICRLEDADYDGHSLSMLRRIAAALGKRLVLTLERDTRGVPAVPVRQRSGHGERPANAPEPDAHGPYRT